ncbi:HAMP domain-containing sensor histidine kinase [Nocardia cyriacigeorgica]|uniref:HAMP domain-containing sensor histidine kinase n=1 Tax=Nocardia cyriacigeorgica TaxID=135487 RepID=UPI000CEA5E03|nr:HAMP domain-containing sensor histidine kinase [Nocardia cyriacigeorgica]PPJ15156.1 sensor histidine kinase [Nocardia cyriacigeorgica]
MMLRTRLTVLVVGAVVAAIAATLMLSYPGVVDLVDDQFERSLNDRADAVIAVLPARLPPRSDTTEQLLLPDGTVGVLMPDGPLLPVTEADRIVARTATGTATHDAELSGETYEILTKPRPGGGAVMVGQRVDGPELIDAEFRWRTGTITALAVAVTAVMSWLAIGRILRPVRRLLAATEQISDSGDLAVPLPTAGRDEIGRLTASFATMLGALRRSRAQQQRLVHDAGHELRTPLTSIRGSAELLHRAKGRLDPADEATVLDTLVQESVALDALVAELVELATDQHTTEEPQCLDLPAVADDCAERFRHRSGRTITVTADAPAPVRGRPKALARCVDNLIGNAIKFSPAGTPIIVHIHGTELAVHDQGPGIDPSETTAVFGRFYRAEGTQAIPGSGLGLAIVDDIVTAHHGTVFAEPGPGARIGFRLPPISP